MLVAPSPATRLPPRLPPSEHRLTIPARPSIVSRRHSATIGPMSPSHLSRPLRSSPLAGPSIAASLDDHVIGPASAPATPGGGSRHLSPLAEFSSTPEPEEEPRPAVDADTKKQRRRTIGSVLSKLSFPATAGGSVSEPPSPPSPTGVQMEGRRRTKSTTSQEAPPVPPVPAWVHNSLPTRSPTRSPRYTQPSPSSSSSSTSLSSPSSSRPPSRPHTAGSYTSTRSRPTSPTPSARSANSALKHGTDPRRASLRPSTSRSPEENWLTQSAAPRFSRLGLKAEGVILPVSAKEARRRSTASLASLKRSAGEFDALPPPPSPLPSHPVTVTVSSRTGPSSPASPPATTTQSRFRSRASSRTSLASAASGISADCDTPSLTMSPGPSASDVSLSAETEADEMGVLHGPGCVEVRVNDVRVGVLAAPAAVYTGKGKERERERAGEVGEGAFGGGLAPWARRGRESANGSTPSLALSSAATSVADVSFGGAPLHVRAATAPDLVAAAAEAEAKAKGTGKRSRTLGRVWKQVVRSVTLRR
ncbi:hypothetical protein C8Q79DRAFT_455003 [Trametes meyenii]|nr:hypothetical protein C8Q79DRAFT_455003 [Trametes meyenii]